MRQRVAGVAGNRADAVLLDDRRQQLGAASEGGIPADLLPLPVDLDHRASDAVGVLVYGPEGGALRADVAAAPRVITVASDARDSTFFDMNLQAAHGLTQWTGVEVPSVLADASQRFGEPGRHNGLLVSRRLL